MSQQLDTRLLNVWLCNKLQILAFKHSRHNVFVEIVVIVTGSIFIVDSVAQQ